MVHWTEEYSTALAVRDETEKANIPLYNAYTRLADRTSRMTTTTNPPLDNVSAEKDKDKEKEKGQHAASPNLPTKTQQQGEVDDILAATRADFAEAQRSRTELQNRLDQVGAELEKLRRRSGQSQRQISSLDSERMRLNLRLRDREEELRGKAKLLDDFQDELATLNLQLNMAEDRSSRLQRENKELVDRWMARVGKEADAMNDRYEFS